MSRKKANQAPQEQSPRRASREIPSIAPHLDDEDKLAIAVALNALAIRIVQALEEFTRDKKLEPRYEETYQLFLEEFNYTTKGVAGGHYQIRRGRRPVWHHVYNGIRDHTSSWPEFKKAMRCISRNKTVIHDPCQQLMFFVERVFDAAMRPTRILDRVIASTIYSAVQELSGAPIRYKSRSEVVGLVLPNINISFQCNGIKYRLRQIEKKDLEREQSHQEWRRELPLAFPTGILEITMYTTSAINLQKKVREAVIAFCLFQPTVFETLTTETETDAVFDWYALIKRGGLFNLRYTAGIPVRTDDDVARFFRILQKALDHHPIRSNPKAPKPVDIAYERYVEALKGGGIEKQIAAAVMGLEALLSDGGDNLRYKLTMRTTCLLSQYGLKPMRIKEIVGLAYKIRNKYVHGGQFKKKDDQAIVSLAGSQAGYITELNEYLRLTLLTMIFANESKDSFIKLVDNALIDPQRLKLLRRKIAKAAKCCKPFKALE